MPGGAFEGASCTAGFVSASSTTTGRFGGWCAMAQDFSPFLYVLVLVLVFARAQSLPHFLNLVSGIWYLVCAQAQSKFEFRWA